MDDEDEDMHAPKIEWRLNLNTLVVLAGFASGFVTWGYTFAEMRTNQTGNAEKITHLETRVTANEVALRRVDTLELRTGTIEKQMADTSGTMRNVQALLNKLAADMQTANAILSRIEAAQSRDEEKVRHRMQP